MSAFRVPSDLFVVVSAPEFVASSCLEFQSSVKIYQSLIFPGAILQLIE